MIFLENLNLTFDVQVLSDKGMSGRRCDLLMMHRWHFGMIDSILKKFPFFAHFQRLQAVVFSSLFLLSILFVYQRGGRLYLFGIKSRSYYSMNLFITRRPIFAHRLDLLGLNFAFFLEKLGQCPKIYFFSSLVLPGGSESLL